MSLPATDDRHNTLFGEVHVSDGPIRPLHLIAQFQVYKLKVRAQPLEIFR